jgi:cytoskeletal protein RodZ
MDTHERQEKQREARRRLNAQRTRAGFLRGRVVAVSILCFAALWVVVFTQMATGNDPVLAPKSQAAAKETRQRFTSAGSSAGEAIETTEPRELEPETVEPELVEPEIVEEPVEEPEVVEETVEEPEVVDEPEPELEPLTTGQS